ncbi:hypothetical protein KP509_24G040800 [Ceratopteris richardii]|uniref:Uncharacterized protein n=1 Tax=Ceratopteris richardii TaxID=49495 RepID=A0A8T2RVU9_CERRI|nr:hypothetical protein KP509_24G040800 [Ceratopteris richardii]
MGCADLFEILMAVIIPPVGVLLRFGCRVEFWICLFFTILGYLPGIVYALYVLLGTYPPAPAPPRTYAPSAPLI